MLSLGMSDVDFNCFYEKKVTKTFVSKFPDCVFPETNVECPMKAFPRYFFFHFSFFPVEVFDQSSCYFVQARRSSGETEVENCMWLLKFICVVNDEVVTKMVN